MRRAYLATLLLATILASIIAVPTAPAADPRASLPDIEDEVMCPTCGTVLAHAFSPQAERERIFIRGQIEQGKTKQQIKDALVAEFGEDVLATPRDEGFDLVAYLVPIGAVLLAVAGIALGLMRWRRQGQAASEPAAPSLSSADSARLDKDLSRFDP
jgi:cytochrome c-type biogenesis protein CcmH/NrfF